MFVNELKCTVTLQNGATYVAPKRVHGGRQGEDLVTVISMNVIGINIEPTEHLSYHFEIISSYGNKYCSEVVVTYAPKGMTDALLTYEIPKFITKSGGIATVNAYITVSSDDKEREYITPNLEVEFESVEGLELSISKEEKEQYAGLNIILAQVKKYMEISEECAATAEELKNKANEYAELAQETLEGKANVASTLAGYGITNAYTKTETDLKLSGKADSGNIYTKAEIDAALEHELTEVYGNNDEVMLEYYFQDDTTLETSHYYYFEHPEPLKANTTYKLRIDSYHDQTEIQNFCVCVGDIHHPVIENIPIIFDVETYAFIESEEWVFPKISGNTDKVYFRFDCLDYRHRNHEAPYKLLTPVILPCYHKAQVDSLLEGKTNVDSVYTKSEVDSRLSDKADKANTLSGYGITDAYTKSETDNLLKVKADVDTVYTKAETDARLSNKADTPKKYFFISGDTITLADNTTYCAEGKISTLTIIYPETDFICSLEFTLASEGDITITLPESKYIGGSPTFANGETWELNIKNGVVVGGLVE